jgi:hypothetical protein
MGKLQRWIQKKKTAIQKSRAENLKREQRSQRHEAQQKNIFFARRKKAELIMREKILPKQKAVVELIEDLPKKLKNPATTSTEVTKIEKKLQGHINALQEFLHQARPILRTEKALMEEESKVPTEYRILMPAFQGGILGFPDRSGPYRTVKRDTAGVIKQAENVINACQAGLGQINNWKTQKKNR